MRNITADTVNLYNKCWCSCYLISQQQTWKNQMPCLPQSTLFLHPWMLHWITLKFSGRILIKYSSRYKNLHTIIQSLLADELVLANLNPGVCLIHRQRASEGLGDRGATQRVNGFTHLIQSHDSSWPTVTSLQRRRQNVYRLNRMSMLL